MVIFTVTSCKDLAKVVSVMDLAAADRPILVCHRYNAMHYIVVLLAPLRMAVMDRATINHLHCRYNVY